MVLSPAWSADNRFIYFASTRGGTMNLWKISARGGSPVPITAGRGDDSELDLSADGQKIVFASQRSATNLLEVEVDSTTETGRRWLTTDASRGTLAPAYSPDGRHIAYFTNRKGAENETIWAMDADGSNPVKLVEDSYINVFPRWTPDGQSLVFTARHRGIESSRILRRLSLSGTVPAELPLEPSESTWGDVEPDGRLVLRGANGKVQVFDPADNKVQTLDTDRGSAIRSSPDGRHFAILRAPREPGDTEAGVWVYDLKGEAPRQIFRGWATNHAWAGASELFVVEGKSDRSPAQFRPFGCQRTQRRKLFSIRCSSRSQAHRCRSVPLPGIRHQHDRKHPIAEEFASCAAIALLDFGFTSREKRQGVQKAERESRGGGSGFPCGYYGRRGGCVIAGLGRGWRPG